MQIDANDYANEAEAREGYSSPLNHSRSGQGKDSLLGSSLPSKPHLQNDFLRQRAEAPGPWTDVASTRPRHYLHTRPGLCNSHHTQPPAQVCLLWAKWFCCFPFTNEPSFFLSLLSVLITSLFLMVWEATGPSWLTQIFCQTLGPNPLETEMEGYHITISIIRTENYIMAVIIF